MTKAKCSLKKKVILHDKHAKNSNEKAESMLLWLNWKQSLGALRRKRIVSPSLHWLSCLHLGTANMNEIVLNIFRTYWMFLFQHKYKTCPGWQHLCVIWSGNPACTCRTKPGKTSLPFVRPSGGFISQNLCTKKASPVPCNEFINTPCFQHPCHFEHKASTQSNRIRWSRGWIWCFKCVSSQRQKETRPRCREEAFNWHSAEMKCRLFVP